MEAPLHTVIAGWESFYVIVGSVSGLQWALAACGMAGILYVAIVIGRARRPHQYRPGLEDWVWHAALRFPRHPATALFLIGASTKGA